jgi:hypothetical protein
VLGKLQHHLSGARLDERRSAALALGSFHDTLALPALQTAYELESEPLTRGFVLVSIGRRGGPEARAFLLRTLAQAEGGDRHWAALALGLLGRTDGELSIRAAIRAALKREKGPLRAGCLLARAGAGARPRGAWDPARGAGQRRRCAPARVRGHRAGADRRSRGRRCSCASSCAASRTRCCASPTPRP